MRSTGKVIMSIKSSYFDTFYTGVDVINMKITHVDKGDFYVHDTYLYNKLVRQLELLFY